MARNWNNLSSNYRKRLERGGITKKQYESGTKLEKARGHGTTPEHPERGEGKPKYQEYQRKRNELIDYIQDFKRSIFSGPRYDESRSRINIDKRPETGKARGIKELRAIGHMVDIAYQDGIEDFWDIVDMDSDYESAFYYH